MPVGSDGTLYLREIEVNAVNDPLEIGYGSIGWSSSVGTKIHEEIRTIRAQEAYGGKLLDALDNRFKSDFESLKKDIPQKTDKEISTITNVLLDPGQSAANNINLTIDVIGLLFAQRSSDLLLQQVQVNKYFSKDPLTDTRLNVVSTFAGRLSASRKRDLNNQRFTDAYRAAYLAATLRAEIAYLNSKSNLASQELAALNASRKANQEKIEQYKFWAAAVSATNEHILKTYGAKMGAIAQDLQTGIAGRKVRNFNDAMATFEKIRANPKLKLNAQDTQAVINALNALDKATLADNVSRLGKAFGVVGKIVQADTIRVKAISGFQTGDWKPLMLALEAMAVGTLAATAAGAILAGLLALFGAPAVLAVPAVALLMATVAALVDDKVADRINQLF